MVVCSEGSNRCAMLHSCLPPPPPFPLSLLPPLSPAGEGSFGRVLQAKAEGIVPGMPERNMVAIKTTKGNASTCTCTSLEVFSYSDSYHILTIHVVVYMYMYMQEHTFYELLLALHV